MAQKATTTSINTLSSHVNKASKNAEVKATKLEKMMELMMNKLQVAVHSTEDEDSGKDKSSSDSDVSN